MRLLTLFGSGDIDVCPIVIMARLASCRRQRLPKYREHNGEKDLFEMMQIEIKDDAQLRYHSVFSGAKKSYIIDEEWSRSGWKLIPNETVRKRSRLNVN